jgi:hypothetical protein
MARVWGDGTVANIEIRCRPGLASAVIRGLSDGSRYARIRDGGAVVAAPDAG